MLLCYSWRVRLNDEVFDDIIAFLDSADQVGKNIGTTINVVEAVAALYSFSFSL